MSVLALIAIVFVVQSQLSESMGADGGSAAGSVTAITVSMESPRDVILPGDTVRLTASAVNEDGEPVSVESASWRVDDPLVALVNRQGLVLAREVGRTRVYAAIGGLRDFVEIAVSTPETLPALPTRPADVSPPVPIAQPTIASFIMLLESRVMSEGNWQELQLRIVDPGGGIIIDDGRVVVRSSDPRVVYLINRRVTALEPGSAYLVATVDAMRDSVLVTVEAPEPSPGR